MNKILKGALKAVYLGLFLIATFLAGCFINPVNPAYSSSLDLAVQTDKQVYQQGNPVVVTVSLTDLQIPVNDAYIGLILQNKVGPNYPLAVRQESTGVDGRLTCIFDSGAFAPGTYQITATAGPGLVESADINISNNGPSIILTSPNGGETWVAGEKQTISWYTNGKPGQYVKIELLKNGMPVKNINSKAVCSKGSLSWTIPSDLPAGEDYTVKVTSTNSSCTDTSNNFSIAGPEITVMSPNGGENWVAGSRQAVSWSYKGKPGSYVKIELLKNGEPFRVISSWSVCSKGSYNWTLPSDLPTGDDYSVRLTSTNGSCADMSDGSFSIAGPSITLTSPNGGETWEAGSKQAVSWSYTGKPGAYVKLELLQNGIPVKSINSRTSSNKGSYNWTIPSNLASGADYKVKVTAVNGSCSDTSDSDFSIAGPTLTLDSPNGGESWPAGSKQTINWSYTGIPGSYVKIELLRDGVLVKKITARTLTKNGFYKWTLPANLQKGAGYTIKITSVTNSDCEDISDNSFTIN
ncbi:MAG: Ser-Thr-rich glycosyl-phosphatidyl-inositol-anchored membrane family protein [Pelotomaculum sp. PtaB.Bin104]|nr:MAG: Ser-Thr-rich glycosyl-phosphatidyl-inositol-anchored membrane family protein [Pelotomaculum sp. PtaB.Bin104]